MGLETGNKISDLNTSWPLGTDPVSEGDNHIRLVKTVLVDDVLSVSAGGTIEGDLIVEGATTFLSNVAINKTGQGGPTYLSMSSDPDQTTALRIADAAGSQRGFVGRDSNDLYFLGNTNVVGDQKLRGFWEFSDGMKGNELELTKAGSVAAPTLLFSANGRVGLDSTSLPALRVTVDDTRAMSITAPGGDSDLLSNFAVSGWVTTTGAITANGNIACDRTGAASAGYITLSVDAGSSAAVRIANDGGSNVSMLGRTNGGSFFLGSSSAGLQLGRGAWDFDSHLSISQDDAASFSQARQGVEWSRGVAASAEQLRYYLNGVEAARFEEVGTAANNSLTIMTRQKGDNRYTQTSAFGALISQLVTGGFITQAQANAISGGP